MLWFLRLAICTLCFANVFADGALLHRKDVQKFINEMVQKHHFNKNQLQDIMREAVYQPQIIESMDKPFEKKTWDVYRDLFLTPQRLEAGLEFWRNNQKALEKVQDVYGVPANIIVAILGVETLYGKRQGNYRVLDALTTLAFHYPKRSPYFTRELEEYLLLCREQHVAATHYIGSYAGAIGKPQFMPSSYRNYAIDFKNKGHRDLVANDEDAISSVANYFKQHGWKMNEKVAEPVKVKPQHHAITTNAKQPNYVLKDLVAAGVHPSSATNTKSPEKVGIIELLTPQGEEYWLAYSNFYVITRYNSSPQYALVVYLFSQQLNQQWAIRSQQKPYV